MSYGRNFGMRDFTNVIRSGRFRTPSTGSAFRIGSAVQLDPANAGLMKACADGAAPTAESGIVVYEHIQNKSDALTTAYDSPYDLVPLGVYAQIVHGPGVKVWFKNTPLKTLYDGRTRAAVTMVNPTDLSSVAPGDTLIPHGDGTWSESSTTPWFEVTHVNAATGLVEARFLF